MTIDESGELTVDTIRTRQLCVGNVCVTEEQFRAVFGVSATSTNETSTSQTVIIIMMATGMVMALQEILLQAASKKVTWQITLTATTASRTRRNMWSLSM